MRSNNRGWAVGVALVLASCGAEQPRVPPMAGPRPVAPQDMVSDGPVKLGAPYAVGGVTYTPDDAINYDEVGYASWYGAEAQGANTANGEPFVASGVTAAHKTLPLPSYVEVTALDSGRTILVRVNDRGPFANDRLIDLSQGAAAQLGVTGDGAFAVRVRRVNPAEQERAALRAHGRAAERLETPPALLKVLQGRLQQRRPMLASASTLPPPAKGKAGPKAATPPPSRAPVARPVTPPPATRPPATRPGVDFVTEEAGAPRAAPVQPAPVAAPASADNYVVQVAAFASRDRAQALARRIGASAIEGTGVWRVRFGPYPSQQAAQAGVRSAAAKGFENARIIANDAR